MIRSIEIRIPTFVAGLLLAALQIPASLSAQANYEIPKGDGEVVERPKAADEAIAQLKSPYCPTMLEVCSSGAGAALRDSIVDLALQGWTSEELVEWMIARHGEEYRAMPKREGKALVAWIVPPLGVALGVVVLTVALKGMIRKDEEAAPTLAEGSLTDEDEARLRDAMRAIDEEEEATFF